MTALRPRALSRLRRRPGAFADDGRPFGRLVDFDEDPRRGIAGVDDHEMVRLDSVAELRD